MKLHCIDKYMFLNNFLEESSELKIGKIKISDLVSRYSTPLYVYDASLIEKAYGVVNNTFDQFEVFYSIKANSSLAICKLLKEIGAGAEVASGGELQLALFLGFPSNKIVFAGPAKTNNELLLAIRSDICSINVESFEELLRIERIAKEENKKVNVCLRINTKASNVDANEVMVGDKSKFGIEENLIYEKMSHLSLEYAKIVGIHLYTGSQILSETLIISNLKKALSLSDKLSKEKWFDLKLIDFGGGLEFLITRMKKIWI